MANDISGPVWRIDTIPFSYNDPIKIVNLIWSEPTTAAHQLVIQTVPGKPILDTKASAANVFQNIGFLGWFPSIQITTLQSGVVQIVVGAGK